MSHPLVVNVHRAKRWDVYVGRAGRLGVGEWGNPFIIGLDGNRSAEGNMNLFGGNA